MSVCSEKIKIAAIVGPTGGGKTALSIALAERFGGEIISCDSMQIYRRMDIGTAKPTEEEKRGIPHHMIDVVDPTDPFSCSDYAEMATECAKDIASRGKLPIFCGGTGLYLDSVIRGVRDDLATSDETFREEMLCFAEKNGADALHARLREIDPEAAEATHPNNIRRVVRALEVFHMTGKTKTELDYESRQKSSLFDPLVLCINYENRDVLYDRIDRRVDEMIEAGLPSEVRALYDEGLLTSASTAGQAIGYKEFYQYLSGELSLDEAVSNLKTATKHYAKRQMTWFLHKDYIRLLPVCYESGEMKTFEEIVNNASEAFRNFGFCDII